MGLQKHAQQDVEQKIKELWDAYVAGYNVGNDFYNYPGWLNFKSWMKETHPLLFEYCTEDLEARFLFL